MPRLAIGIDSRISRLSQRAMYILAVHQARGAVDRRAHQGMTETHPGAELDQPGLLGRGRRLRSDPEPLGGAPQQGYVAHRLGSRGQEKSLRLKGERMKPPEEALLDTTRQRPRIGKGEPAVVTENVSGRFSSTITSAGGCAVISTGAGSPTSASMKTENE